jgi:hypothetical protein
MVIVPDVIALSSSSVLTVTVKAAILVNFQTEEVFNPLENEQVYVFCTDSSHIGVQPVISLH